MRKIFPFVLVFLIGCGPTNVPFNKKTIVTYQDNDGVEYKMAITSDSISWGIRFKVQNLGVTEIVLPAESAIYENAKGEPIKAANKFFTHVEGRNFPTDYWGVIVASGHKNAGGISPPKEATTLVFKDIDHKRTYFRLALK